MQVIARERALLRHLRHPSVARNDVLIWGTRRRALLRLSAQLAVVIALFCLAVADIYVRATGSEVEDGILWTKSPEGVVVVREVAAQSPGARANVQAGDILEAVNGRPIDSVADVIQEMHRASNGETLTYTISRTR